MADSINNQLERLRVNVANAYDVMEEAGATMPEQKVSEYLDDTALTLSVNVQAVDLHEVEEITINDEEYLVIQVAEATAKGEAYNQDLTVHANGVYKHESPYSGLGTVTVDVDVNNQNININKEGVYTPSAGYNGFGIVSVEGIVQNQDKVIEAEGVYTADSLHTGLGTVTVQNIVKNQDKTVTTNGIITADSGYTGLGTVNVNVPLGTKNITTNGTYNASSDNLKGFSSVTVNVPPRNQDLEILTNGTYTPDVGYTGLGTVTVNIPTEIHITADDQSLVESLLAIKAVLLRKGIVVDNDFTQYATAMEQLNTVSYDEETGRIVIK